MLTLITVTTEVITLLGSQHEKPTDSRPFSANEDDLNLVKSILSKNDLPLDVIMSDFVRLDSHTGRLIDKGWVFEGVFFYGSKEDADTHAYDYFGSPVDHVMKLYEKGDIALSAEYIVFGENTQA